MATIKRARRSDASRNYETIVAAATAVLAQSPNASMTQIARASGTGRTTLYRHFPDRQSLISAIYDRVLLEADAITAAELSRDDDPVAVVAALCERLAGLGDHYRFLETHYPQVGARDPDDMLRRAAPLRNYLAAAQKAAAISTDLDPEWLLAVLVGLIMQASGHRFTDSAQRSQMLGMTVTTLLTPSASPAEMD